MYRGVIWGPDGGATEVLTEGSGDGTRALVIERDASSGARRVVAVMESLESAGSEADLRVVRAGGFLRAGLAQLLNRRPDGERARSALPGRPGEATGRCLARCSPPAGPG